MSGDQTISSEWLDGMRALEEALWTSETRGNPAWMELVLAPDFTEHGRSGSVWSRADIIEMAIGDEIDVVLPLPDYTIRMVAENVALATYTSIVGGTPANRGRPGSQRGSTPIRFGTPRSRPRCGATTTRP